MKTPLASGQINRRTALTALAGRSATVSSVERDIEGRFYIAVLVDDDPGVSIGPRRPGHRFFFAPEEVELAPAEEQPVESARRTILVAGIGNIFLGDDAFGVEVARRLSGRAVPEGVQVGDYGIRGYDLAYALADDPDCTILVDACPRGDAPGTVYLIEPSLDSLDDESQPLVFDAHTMNPVSVLRLARSMGAPLRQPLRGFPNPPRRASRVVPTGGRCRCPALLVPCPSANVPGGRDQAAPAETLLPGLHRLPP